MSKCTTCRGKDYFQKYPDCGQCPVWIDGDCNGSENNLCVIRSVCPSCNGTGNKPQQEIESYSVTEIQYFHRQGKDYDYCKEHEVRRLESATDCQESRIAELEKELLQHKESVLMFMRQRNNALSAHDLAVKEQYSKSNEVDILKSKIKELEDRIESMLKEYADLLMDSEIIYEDLLTTGRVKCPTEKYYRDENKLLESWKEKPNE